MSDRPDSQEWDSKLVQPLFPWISHTARPADVISGLKSSMLSREHILEDANYTKIIPNQFIVELSESNYQRNYRPIQDRILRQWREKLMDHLMTTNSRQGRKEYRFGGSLQITIRPAPELHDEQARILSRIQPNLPGQPGQREILPACLEAQPGRQRYPLFTGITSLGRSETCDIYLNDPDIQEKRLVSSQHAYIQAQDGEYILFDGSPGGKPSVNGTYLNQRKVSPTGSRLSEGDLIILAAINPQSPRSDTPGAAVFRFHMDCSS